MQQVSKAKIIQLLKGSLAGIIIMALTVIGSVLLLYKGGINNSAYMPLLIACAVFSGLSAGFFGTRNIKKNGLINGALSSIIPSFIMFSATTLASSFEPINLFLTIVVIIGGAIGGILAVNTKNKKRK